MTIEPKNDVTYVEAAGGASAAPQYRWSADAARRVHAQLHQLLSADQSPFWDGASIFVAMPADITLASAATPDVTAADEQQLRLDQGPALSCLATGRNLLVDDTTSDQRWPAWAAAVAQSGWRSVWTQRVGTPAAGAALCLYARRVEAFSLEALAAAETLAGRSRTGIAAALEAFYADSVDRDQPGDNQHGDNQHGDNQVNEDQVDDKQVNEDQAGDEQVDKKSAKTVVAAAILRVMDHHDLDQYAAFEYLCERAKANHGDLIGIAHNIMGGRHGLA